jgi:chromate transporter
VTTRAQSATADGGATVEAENLASRPVAAVGLWPFVAYFLRLGTVGFGGPVALVGYMQRDLVERRGWIDDEEYKLGLALAQIMPGPLAAQLAIAIGYFAHGVLGATLVGIAFVLPVVPDGARGLAVYVAYDGLWWMQAAFYGVSPPSSGSSRSPPTSWPARSTGATPARGGSSPAVRRHRRLAQAELAEFFLLAGLVVLVVQAPPRWLKPACRSSG